MLPQHIFLPDVVSSFLCLFKMEIILLICNLLELLAKIGIDSEI